MPADQNQVTFRCIIKSVSGGEPLSDENHTENKGTILKVLNNKIRADYGVPGNMAFYRPRSRDDLSLGDKITKPVTTLNDALDASRTLIIMYDQQTSVSGGGYAEGGVVYSTTGKPVRALGGIAGGGEMDAKGNMRGGYGAGGNAYGENIRGRAGKGGGGGANSNKPGVNVDAGVGAGGDLVELAVDKS